MGHAGLINDGDELFPFLKLPVKENWILSKQKNPQPGWVLHNWIVCFQGYDHQREG